MRLSFSLISCCCLEGKRKIGSGNKTVQTASGKFLACPKVQGDIKSRSQAVCLERLSDIQTGAEPMAVEAQYLQSVWNKEYLLPDGLPEG